MFGTPADLVGRESLPTRRSLFPYLLFKPSKGSGARWGGPGRWIRCVPQLMCDAMLALRERCSGVRAVEFAIHASYCPHPAGERLHGGVEGLPSGQDCLLLTKLET
jgi:hypothetical protein